MSWLELISKGKNGFGDTVYHIRDQSSGVTSIVYEDELQNFMKKKGVSEIKEGSSFMYPRKK